MKNFTKKVALFLAFACAAKIQTSDTNPQEHIQRAASALSSNRNRIQRAALALEAKKELADCPNTYGGFHYTIAQKAFDKWWYSTQAIKSLEIASKKSDPAAIALYLLKEIEQQEEKDMKIAQDRAKGIIHSPDISKWVTPYTEIRDKYDNRVTAISSYRNNTAKTTQINPLWAEKMIAEAPAEAARIAAEVPF